MVGTKESVLILPHANDTHDAGTPTEKQQQRRSGKLRWLLRGALSVLVVLILLCVSLIVPAKTFAQIIPGQALIDRGAAVSRPGSAQSVVDRVSISGHQQYPPAGDFLFTTVSIDVDVSVFDWLEAEVNKDAELHPLVNILGDQTPQESRTRNRELMRRSKEDAVLAALEFLGVPIVETGVGFGAVIADSPAHNRLLVGDVIVGVDDAPVTSLASLRRELALKVPGQVGIVTVEAADTGQLTHVTIVWGSHPQGAEGAYLGIGEIVPRLTDETLGIDVSIDTGSTGGPSAGLAFTLAIIDLLTPGELTGNNRVAVTGQIFVGGVVGNVGGVAQKTVAARSAGATAFIVPADLVEVAELYASDMAIFGVSTLDEAIEVLGALGGDTDNLSLRLEPSS
ncbi:MAG: hypothetical protein KTU85_03575 [Acidimicrobiia bacterium]|nr:hypothetical protein [Acidimicrobiia bacterium]MCY4457603.1 hypothetical protein [Acidimicrobiaceae bacterium]